MSTNEEPRVNARQILARQTLSLASGILLAGFFFFRMWHSAFGVEWYQAALFLSPIGLAALFPTARLSALAGLTLGSALAVIAQTALDLYRDPSCCNLWPIGIVLVFVFCLPATLIGGFAANLLGRTRLPRTFYAGPLLLSLAIPALFPYIEGLQQRHLQTETMPRLMNEIYQAEMTYRASRPDGTFTCDGKQLPRVGNLKWGHVGGETLDNLLIVGYYSISLECLNDAAPRSFRVWARNHEYGRIAPSFFIDTSGTLTVSETGTEKPKGSVSGKSTAPTGSSEARP